MSSLGERASSERVRIGQTSSCYTSSMQETHDPSHAGKSLDLDESYIYGSTEEATAEIHENQLTSIEGRIKKIAESLETNLHKLKTFSGIVRNGTGKFVEIGLALQEISHYDLWKDAGHSSWETYCPREHGFSKSHANRIIMSAKIATYLEKQKPEGVAVEHMKPRAESQVRPMGKVPKEYWLEVWCQAVEIVGGIPTQRDVAFVVESKFGSAGTTNPKNPSLTDIVKEVVVRFRLVLDENGSKKELEKLVAELEEAVKLKIKVDGQKTHT